MAKKLSQEKIDKIQSMYPSYKKREITLKEIAKIVNVDPATVRKYTVIEEHFGSSRNYLDRNAKKNGHNSHTDYVISSFIARQKRPQNQSLSRLINNALAKRKKYKKNQNWLAEQIGRTKASVSLYAQGRVMPDKPTFEKICYALGIKYETLDDRLKEHYK